MFGKFALSIKKTQLLGGILAMTVFMNLGTGVLENTAEASVNIYPEVKKDEYMKMMRINWDVIPGAVSYNLVLLKNKDDSPADAVTARHHIYTNGYEIDTSVMRQAKEYYWSVCPVSYQGIEIGPYTEPKPLVEEEWNPTTPRPTTEFDKMAYSPLYPVFSWVPTNGAHSYDLRVVRDDQQNNGSYEVIRNTNTDNNIFYEYAGYTWPGQYYWQVRSKDEYNHVIADWSEPCRFTVEKEAKVAALGDSITHGGGASTVPPGYSIYNWETYCQVPVKNLGLSGDTVQNMCDRFEQEVVPFSPKILVVMGGVNNFRAGEDAWETIDAMENIRSKCRKYGIIAVFLTATPINENLIDHVPSIGHPAWNWKYEQQVLNGWIKQQQFWIDVTPQMTDSSGRLRADMTTDGLHPDYEGKKLIGEMVNDYLLKTFPHLNLLEK